MDLQSDQKMGSISAHMHSCMHCGRAQSDTMVAAVHRMLQCAAMASNVAQFKDKDFGQSMDWDASPDALVLSILSPGGKISHHGDQVLYWNAVATLFRPLAEACRFFG
jgi:hypothetical protein